MEDMDRVMWSIFLTAVDSLIAQLKGLTLLIEHNLDDELEGNDYLLACVQNLIEIKRLGEGQDYDKDLFAGIQRQLVIIIEQYIMEQDEDVSQKALPILHDIIKKLKDLKDPVIPTIS